MAELPGAPGWYRDPLERTWMRHWTGFDWDTRRRPAPPWLSETGPLPVTVAGDPDGGQTRPEGRDHPASLASGVSAAAGSGLVRSAPPSGPRPGHHGPDRPRPPRQTPAVGPHPRPRLRPWSQRTPVLVVSALVVVSLLVLAGTVGVAKTPVPSGAVSADTSFVHRADVACTSSLGAVRIPTATDVNAKGAALTPSPATINAANRALGVLLAKLRSFPVTSTVRVQIQDWLDEWTQFATDRARDAAYVTAHPTPDASQRAQEQSLATSARQDAIQADSFALSNSLGDCTLESGAAKTVGAF